jgi:hypothetical protein
MNTYIHLKNDMLNNYWSKNWFEHKLEKHKYVFISNILQVKKVKLSLQQAVEAHRFVRCQGSHIF